MDIKDIKIGMKVKLLSKSFGIFQYENIENFYEDLKHNDTIQQIKKQGYGVVGKINFGVIYIDGWEFLPSDLEPYEKVEDVISEDKIKSIKEKTPKEWLLTPMVTFITRNGFKCITLGNGTSYIIETGEVWDNELDENYDNDLNYIVSNNSRFDIMQITYEGKVVWKRKEYITLTDAIKTGKKIKLKDWDNFVYPADVMLLLSDKEDELINLFTDKVWEVE